MALQPFSPAAPLRPLFVLALVLVVACELALRTPLHGNPLACWLAGSLLVAVCPRGVSRAQWAAMAVLVMVVLLRGQAVAIPSSGSGAAADRGWTNPVQAAGEHSTPGTRVGCYRAGPTGLGWLEAPDGLAPTELVQFKDLSLTEGEWVAIPTETELLAWPRGVRPGPMAADFPRGVAIVEADEVVRLAATPTADGFRILGAEDGREPSLAARLVALRARLARTAARDFAPETAGVARALLFGDRSRLDGETADLFTRTGTRHLLAVSGLHVGLAAALFLLPLSRWIERRVKHRELGRRVGCLLFTLLLFGFAVLAGHGAPVVRAAAALALAALARYLPSRRGGPEAPSGGRQADALSLWALVLIVELLFDARATRSLAIQLSYLATLGILFGTRPLERATRGLLAKLRGNRLADTQIRSPGWGAVLWRVPVAKTARFLLTGLAASSAAVIATLPITWSRFGEYAPVGILVTALILPLFIFVMATLWSHAALVPLVVCPPLRELASDSIGLLLSILEQVDRLPATPLALPQRPVLLVALASFSLCLALSSRRLVWRRAAALGFGLLFLPWTAAPAGLEVELLDVGHGCALFVRAPGEPCLIFDAGSRDRRYLYREALAPQLARWEVANPVLALTHDDRDHASGMSSLVERYPPRLWLGEAPEELMRRLPKDCARLDLGVRALRLTTATGPLGLTLLRGSNEPGNEGSRALVLEFENERLLLFGDSEGSGLRRMLSLEELKSPVDLLLFPHHGSETPWLSDLLSTTTPEQIWISAGAEPALAAELERRGLRWFSTSQSGPLTSHSAEP